MERYCGFKKENDFRESNEPFKRGWVRAKRTNKKENNVVLFGVPASTATTYEEREKEDENITCQILEEIGISKAEQEAAKIIRFRANPTKETSKPLHIRVSFGAKYPTDLVVEEVLKQAKIA